jgi:hypothetical protein
MPATTPGVLVVVQLSRASSAYIEVDNGRLLRKRVDLGIVDSKPEGRRSLLQGYNDVDVIVFVLRGVPRIGFGKAGLSALAANFG